MPFPACQPAPSPEPPRRFPQGTHAGKPAALPTPSRCIQAHHYQKLQEAALPDTGKQASNRAMCRYGCIIHEHFCRLEPESTTHTN